MPVTEDILFTCTMKSSMAKQLNLCEYGLIIYTSIRMELIISSEQMNTKQFTKFKACITVKFWNKLILKCLKTTNMSQNNGWLYWNIQKSISFIEVNDTVIIIQYK